MRGWKVLTDSWGSPIQGGQVCDGRLPYTLPTVKVDRGGQECGEGWNFTRDPSTALSIAGMWPDGRPSRLIQIDTGRRQVTERGDKCRVSGGTLVREATSEEWREALSFGGVFGVHTDTMVDAQMSWRDALGRPQRDVRAVEAGLMVALTARGLGWSLRCYANAWDAWEAWDARDARDARAAWEAWDARDVRDARAAWDARDARAARDARDACLGRFAALNQWIDTAPDRFEAGIIDAYRNGLAVAIPVAEGTLGWAMTGEGR